MTYQSEQLQRLSAYVRYAADHLRLRDWEFRVGFDENLDESLASIVCVPNRMLAVLCVGPLFYASPAEERKHGIVHELVHCHLQRARTMFDTLSEHHGPAHCVHKRNHDDHLECGVDALAGALAAGLLDPEQFAKRRDQKPVSRKPV